MSIKFAHGGALWLPEMCTSDLDSVNRFETDSASRMVSNTPLRVQLRMALASLREPQQPCPSASEAARALRSRIARACQKLVVGIGGIILAISPACFGGQTGQEEERTLPCASPPQPIALDTPTPADRTANDAIALAEELRTAAFHWHRPDPDLPSPDTMLTLTLRYEGGQAFYLDNGLAENGTDRLCVSSIRVPLQANLRTADGALADSFPIILDMDAQDHAFFEGEIELSTHSGSFQAVAVDRSFFLTPQLSFAVELGPTNTHGRLTLTEGAEANGVGAGKNGGAIGAADTATATDGDAGKAHGSVLSGVLLAEW